MEDCNEQEILGIINDLQNGKSSDTPIVTIKVARTAESGLIFNFSYSADIL